MINHPKMLDHAKEFACDFLWIDSLAVEVEFVTLPQGCYGNAYESCEDEYCVEISDSLDIKDSLITLFHELTHVRQFMLGHLYYKNDKLAWKGDGYDCEEPWEFEAYAYEKIIYELYVNTANSVEHIQMLH